MKLNPSTPDYIGQVNGLSYKLGRFGRVYYWNDIDWIRSERTEEQVIRAIDMQKSTKAAKMDRQGQL